jgi:2-dehydro-3-deoxyphosphogalactonate aldolase
MNLTMLIKQFPLIAVLRGVTPQQVSDVAKILIAANFVCIEVPLNSPEPFTSIDLLRQQFGKQVLIGAGTVWKTQQLLQAKQAGAQMIVMPHCDTQLIQLAKKEGLICLAGIMTPSEAFSAIIAGADGLKLFPSEMITPSAIRAMKVVLPQDMPLIAVGGITPEKLLAYYQAGCMGFGLGSALFKTTFSLKQIEQNALTFQKSWLNAKNSG